MLHQQLINLLQKTPEELAELAENHGSDYLHSRLRRIDPESSNRIHPNDTKRLIRALEVYELTGSSLSELCAAGRDAPPGYRFLKIILAPEDRALLHERIRQRFNLMLEQGFLDEVRALHERGDLSSDLPSMRAVGYRQAWDYLDGKLSADEWVERAVIATRQYAKRQMTWLRSEPDCHWVDSLGQKSLAEVLELVHRAGAAAS